jgi:hypothetical protein
VRFVPKTEATKIIEEQDSGELARIAWRAAVPRERHGMAVLKLSSGKVMPYPWPADKDYLTFFGSHELCRECTLERGVF